MDNAQRDLRARLDQWRVDHEQDDQETVKQLLEAATHYAPGHRLMREAIATAWSCAIVAEIECQS